MLDKYKALFSQTVTAILSHLPKKRPEGLEAFTHQYFAKMPLVSYEKLDTKHAAAIATTSFDFIASRTPGEAKIRIFTPNEKEHGWKSQHTIIQILNDDMPFLVDSVTMELTRQGFTIYETFHPILTVARDGKGKLIDVSSSGIKSKGDTAESLIHIEFSALPASITADALMEEIKRVLYTVRIAVDDWSGITQKVREIGKQLSDNVTNFKLDDVQEVKDFMQWVADKNFIFLGCIEYDFYDKNGKEALTIVEGSERGIFRLDDPEIKPQGLAALPAEVMHFALVPQLIEITKSSRKSTVHRAVPMDYIGIKRFNNEGKVIGETRFLGLFTSIVYYQSAETIPLIRRKIMRTLARANLDPVSHDGKALKAILEFYPRDELFQISEDDLFDVSMGILYLESRPSVRLFVRKDAFERFVSCLLFVPRERFSTAIREQVQDILQKSYNGTIITYYTQVTDSPLARVQIIIRTTPGSIPKISHTKVEEEIIGIVSQWSDLLRESLLEKYDERQAEQLFRTYSTAFPKTYLARHDVPSAIHDIGKIEEAVTSGTLSLELFRSRQDSETIIRLKIYNPKAQVPLSDILPMLENMGFKVIDENPFLISLADTSLWIRDFQLTALDGRVVDVDSLKPVFEEALEKVWYDEMENDGFNTLVLKAGLPWRDVVLLRALAKYLKQTGFVHSQPYIEQALAAHPSLTVNIVELFYLLFDPARKTRSSKDALLKQMEDELANVPNLVEDKIIRRFISLITSMWRTNFFQTDEKGNVKSYISFKFDSSQVPELPLPRPYAEIFVYSTRVEGIHLRGGKVARGGLRWSDRREDFRTEVLGLMKAQMVKNAVIVPVGSKGGFVVKQPPKEGGREAFMEEGIFCYKTYLRGLLDVTDNITASGIVPPKQVVRQDGDDPYLVVAADKGTASFSDIANSVSAEYGFWLGDAFASGGSAGYDHKKMAITARGAWISVVRHFSEMGVDIDTSAFTVVGIGDMSGDVFGNGMLLSRHIKLVGAFNHQHIFLDPNPDVEKSFIERERLFKLPRSSWKDYDASLISKGGGVYERSAKSIPLSDEIRAVLGIVEKALSPDELMRALLLAPVDLLWNGGIGTYVKAEDETHEQVGDRANNALRVNGKDLRCKLVGEGGNLGFTQKGRREYALNGGRINTDAIDNSAGVDCSDHEVNIKIALGIAEAAGKLNTEKRNLLLASMTDDVAALVLKDNTLQTQAITIAQLQAPALIDSHSRLIKRLEKAGQIDRAVEFLPSEKGFTELRAAKRGLTRPELAVLLAYSKMTIYKDILESDLPDDPYLLVDLMRYFPKTMQNEYASEIEQHRLRREIIATVVTNSVVNRTGITFLQDIADDTGLPTASVARAYTIARDAFGLRALWSEIEALGTSVSETAKVDVYAELTQFLDKATTWFLRNCAQPIDIQAVLKEYMPGIEAFLKAGASAYSPAIEKAYGKKLAKFLSTGLPEALAHRIAGLEALSFACDIIHIANRTKLGVAEVATIFFTVGGRLKLGWLRISASALPVESHWQRLAILSLISDVSEQQRRLTGLILKDAKTVNRDAVEKWCEQNSVEIARYDAFIEDIKALGQPDFATLVVAARNVKLLASV